MTAEAFSASQACRLVGISYRQVDYWARTGLVVPSLQDAQGSGTKRRYSFADLVELRTVKQLIDAGVALVRIRRALAVLRAEGEDPAALTLLSDGASIYACHSAEEVVDVLRRGQGVFGLALGPVIEQMRGSVVAMASPGPDTAAAPRPQSSTA